MREKSFIIRFDADKLTGSGHFIRCRALGESLMTQGFKVIYACKHVNDGTIKILNRWKSPYLLIPENVTWAKEAEYLLSDCQEQRTGVVLDISTPYAFEDLVGVTDYIKMLREQCLVVLIDGMGGNALLTKVNPQVDFLVVPYFGAQDFEHAAKEAGVNLVGPQYFIFSQEYEAAAFVKRQILPLAEKILVTFGGADPYEVTMMVLSAIENIKNRKLSLRVVVGPHFDTSLREKILHFVSESLHPCEVVEEPSSLLEHMFWCDMAMTSSGLTKYELAITGTPSLLISFNEDYAAVNDSFAKEGCAKHLGVHDRLDRLNLSCEILGLIDNARMRRSMSESGRRLLDGKGVSRIIEAIRRKI